MRPTIDTSAFGPSWTDSATLSLYDLPTTLHTLYGALDHTVILKPGPIPASLRIGTS
jgi:hypothetical protein